MKLSLENERRGIVGWARGALGHVPVKLPKTTPKPAPDGYLRITPVQELRVPDGYAAGLVKKVIMAFIGLAFIAAIIYVLLSVAVF